MVEPLSGSLYYIFLWTHWFLKKAPKKPLNFSLHFNLSAWASKDRNTKNLIVSLGHGRPGSQGIWGEFRSTYVRARAHLTGMCAVCAHTELYPCGYNVTPFHYKCLRNETTYPPPKETKQRNKNFLKRKDFGDFLTTNIAFSTLPRC